MGNTKDLTGMQFTRLLVLRKVDKPSHVTSRGSYWLCQCDCGQQKVIIYSALVKGNSKSCGCLRKDAPNAHRTHGMGNTNLYHQWANMIQRCTNENHRDYHKYGGRGITVCDQWLNSFESFYADMGDKPPYLSLDRINNDEGYYKENCRWATRQEQQLNRRPYNEWEFNDGRNKKD